VVYRNGMGGIEIQIKTEKIIFTKSNANEATEDLICYSFYFRKIVWMLFLKKDFNYWFFNY